MARQVRMTCGNCGQAFEVVEKHISSGKAKGWKVFP